jgi:hypothetical protein
MLRWPFTLYAPARTRLEIELVVAAVVVADDLPALAGLRLQLQRHAAYLNRRRCRSHAQLQIDALTPTHLNADVVRDGIGKPRSHRRDFVLTHAQRRHLVVARSA